jgi:hypothetical protein
MGEGNLKSAESATTTRQKRREEKRQRQRRKRHRKERKKESAKNGRRNLLISTKRNFTERKRKEHGTFPQDLFIFMRKNKIIFLGPEYYRPFRDFQPVPSA